MNRSRQIASVRNFAEFFIFFFTLYASSPMGAKRYGPALQNLLFFPHIACLDSCKKQTGGSQCPDICHGKGKTIFLKRLQLLYWANRLAHFRPMESELPQMKIILWATIKNGFQPQEGHCILCGSSLGEGHSFSVIAPRHRSFSSKLCSSDENKQTSCHQLWKIDVCCERRREYWSRNSSSPEPFGYG